MKGDDYFRGRHFWVHFWCGLFLGALLGVRICWGLFVSPWAFFGGALTIGLLIALVAGYWGDPFWHWFLKD